MNDFYPYSWRSLISVKTWTAPIILVNFAVSTTVFDLWFKLKLLCEDVCSLREWQDKPLLSFLSHPDMHVNEPRECDTESLPYNILCRRVYSLLAYTSQMKYSWYIQNYSHYLSMLFNLSQKVNSNTIVRHHFDCFGVVCP